MKRLAAMLCLAALTGCAAVGPNYHTPATTAPASFQAGQPQAGAPSQEIAQLAWWKVFGDPLLASLEEQCLRANQNLKAALARTEEARAFTTVARSFLFPTVGANASAVKYREARDRPNSNGKGSVLEDFLTGVSFNYELDAWGRVRRSLEAANAEVQASQADLETVRLSLTAELAVDYFSLREIDAQQSVLSQTVKALKASHHLTTLRYQNGLASKLDVQQAQTLLQSEEAQSVALGVGRKQFENAIAVLTGQPATGFAIPPSPLLGTPPALTPGLPIDLLSHRPDIAERERTLAARSAQIGVAQAQRFPTISLTGALGFESTDAGTLFNWAANRTFTLGSGLTAPLFNAGRLKAQVTASQAAYREAEANYRQSVLVAFGEVETQLNTLHVLADQAAFQEAATESARQATATALDRYRNGIESYLSVVTQQTVQLQNELTAAQIVGQRYVATVNLIKALGGGWADSQIYPR